MRLTKTRREALVGAVLDQILDDITNEQTDAIYALLLDCPGTPLVKFLPRETQQCLGLLDSRNV